MERGRPRKRLKLDDIKLKRARSPTPDDESPSPYNVSPNVGEKEHETRFPFPEKGSKEDPFPDGLPHANRFGAIRPRPFYDYHGLDLLQPPDIANWRPYEPYNIMKDYPQRNIYNKNLRLRSPPKEKPSRKKIRRDKRSFQCATCRSRQQMKHCRIHNIYHYTSYHYTCPQEQTEDNGRLMRELKAGVPYEDILPTLKSSRCSRDDHDNLYRRNSFGF